MAGTADNFVSAAVAKGPGKLYAGLSIPAAGVRLILASDGTPDATQNPTAQHLGMTESGSEFLVRPSVTNFFADEFVDPILSQVEQEEKVISGALLQIADMDIAQTLLPTATRSDVMGTKGLTFGGAGNLTYTSVALIFPLQAAAGEYGVFHLYKAFNDQGLAAKITRKALSSSPFAFRGLGITSRPAGDQAGRWYIQQAVGS
jgi:hypothetical protein